MICLLNGGKDLAATNDTSAERKFIYTQIQEIFQNNNESGAQETVYVEARSKNNEKNADTFLHDTFQTMQFYFNLFKNIPKSGLWVLF